MNAPKELRGVVGQPDETGKTDAISNIDFLERVFELRSGDACPLIVSFRDDATAATKKRWSGKPWEGRNTPVDPPLDANNFFSLATFKPDGEMRYRPVRSRFHALYAVVVDHVGTKVPKDRLSLLPSWLIEISAGDFQAGYLLSEAVEDAELVDRLIEAMVEKGLCERYANGPRAQSARLPVGANNTEAAAFACRLAAWSPMRRYAFDQVVEGLGLGAAGAIRQPSGTQLHDCEQPDAVLTPTPDENKVLAALRERGLYMTRLSPRKHEIVCPWPSEPTANHLATYFEPDVEHSCGGFKCVLERCKGRHIGHLLHYLRIRPSAARMKPKIRIRPGEYHRVVDAAEWVLARSGGYYQRGGLIVGVRTDPGTRETVVQDVSEPALVYALSAAADWERFDRRAGDWVPTDPPARPVRSLLKGNDFRYLPVLTGLARQPYLRTDGTIMADPGYDPQTCMYGAFDAHQFHVPQEPSRADAEAALALLKEALQDFPFATPTDLAGALTAMITAAIRPSLDRAPMFHTRAPVPGSGKSCLNRVITAMATPEQGAPMTFPADDEECRKLLHARLMRAPATIEFDNLVRDLVPHPSLCSALSEGFVEQRILGTSTTSRVDTRAVFLSSGNNVRPIQDMIRRTIDICLDPVCENPSARTFRRPHLIESVLRERGHYVSAALTIVCAWILAGRPMAACNALAGFGHWSDFCRQPLLWLGCEDPVPAPSEAMNDDPDRELLGRLLAAWEAKFGGAPTRVRDAVAHASEYHNRGGELMDVLQEIAGEFGVINRGRLGRWIARHERQIVDGRRFERDRAKRSAEAWRVDSVLTVWSDSSGSTTTTGNGSDDPDVGGTGNIVDF